MNEELQWKQKYEKKKLELSQLIEKLDRLSGRWRSKHGGANLAELEEILSPYWRRRNAAEKLQQRVASIEAWRAGGSSEDFDTADLIQFDDVGRCLICQKFAGGDRNHRCWMTPDFPFDVLEEWPL